MRQTAWDRGETASKTIRSATVMYVTEMETYGRSSSRPRHRATSASAAAASVVLLELGSSSFS